MKEIQRKVEVSLNRVTVSLNNHSQGRQRDRWVVWSTAQFPLRPNSHFAALFLQREEAGGRSRLVWQMGQGPRGGRRHEGLTRRPGHPAGESRSRDLNTAHPTPPHRSPDSAKPLHLTKPHLTDQGVEGENPFHTDCSMAEVARQLYHRPDRGL